MPISIAALKSNTRTIEIDFGEGQVLTLSYRPNAFGVAMQNEERALQADGQPLAAMAASLVRLLASWDLTTDDGAPLPITRETLETECGLPLMRVMIDAIREDLLPNLKAAVLSGSGLTPAARSANGLKSIK